MTFEGTSYYDHCTDALNENGEYYVSEVVSTDSQKSICFLSGGNLHSPHTFLPEALLDSCCPRAISHLSKS